MIPVEGQQVSCVQSDSKQCVYVFSPICKHSVYGHSEDSTDVQHIYTVTDPKKPDKVLRFVTMEHQVH